MNRLRTTTIVVLLGSFLCGASGCVSVQPWQRGRLSHAWMGVEPRLGDGFVDHARSVREGSVGGRGGAGGGCGCN